MRTSRTLSVSMPPAQLKQAERLARKENRTLSELVREALRQYQQKQESPVNTELIAALRAVQEDARRSGLDKLPQRAINAEVLAHRREQRQKKLKQPVR
jgi:Arc/MetJ-type ribon-helix-helix transcriptional regulator